VKLRRVDFVRTVPSPLAVAVPVPFLEVGKAVVGHPERYVESLEYRDGYVWVGEVGYPREQVARVVRMPDADPDPLSRRVKRSVDASA